MMHSYYTQRPKYACVYVYRACIPGDSKGSTEPLVKKAHGRARNGIKGW